MKPLRDWMILELHKEDTGKVILPDIVQGKIRVDESATMIVKAVGPGWYENGVFNASEVKVGDIVVMEGMYIHPMVYKGHKFVVGRARDVAFIVEQKIEQKGEQNV